MTRTITTISLLSLAIGCEPLPYDGGQSGEESITCAPISSVDLAADEASALGFGRTEVVDLAEGAHSGTLTYAAGGSAGLTLDVTAGDARFLDMDWVDSGTGELATPATEIGCADLVEVDATVVFSTDDGAFDETWDTALQAASVDSSSFWMDLDLLALGGSFTYTPDADYDEVSAWASGTFDATGAHGVVEGQGTASTGTDPDDSVSATSLQMAQW